VQLLAEANEVAQVAQVHVRNAELTTERGIELLGERVLPAVRERLAASS
jgi:hypothetical protein